MSEKYNFLENHDFTFFNSLMLGGDVDKILSVKDFDSSKLEVDLKLNGVSIRVEDFNNFMAEWYDRIKSSIKEDLGLLNAESAVEEKAILLIKERCEKAWELLNHIEECESIIYKS